MISIDTNLVTLTATVADKQGRYFSSLKQGDFTVYEDGAPQKLAYFNTGDRVPVSLGIIFDTSGSMVDKIEDVRDAVEHFVKSVAPGDEIFLVRFSDDAELVQDFTDDRRRILRSIENLEPQGSTALYDATLLGLQCVAEGKHRKKALMLVTDGNDTVSSVRFQTLLELARKSEVLIYALGIGHGERGSFGHGGSNSGGHGGSSGHDPLGSILKRQIKDGIDMRVLNSIADAPVDAPLNSKRRTGAGATSSKKRRSRSPPNSNSSTRSATIRRTNRRTAASAKSRSRLPTSRSAFVPSAATTRKR